MADRSFADVLQDIVLNVQRIIRSEARLAKAELREEFAAARTGALLTVAGAVLAIFALLFLLLGLLFALSTWMPSWGATMALAGALGVGASFAITTGLKRLNGRRPGSNTVESVKESIEWTKRQFR